MDEALSLFTLNQEQLQLVKTRMREGLEAGLKSKGCTIKMLPSYVYHTPDGTGVKMNPTLPFYTSYAPNDGQMVISFRVTVLSTIFFLVKTFLHF